MYYNANVTVVLVYIILSKRPLSVITANHYFIIQTKYGTFLNRYGIKYKCIIIDYLFIFAYLLIRLKENVILNQSEFELRSYIIEKN